MEQQKALTQKLANKVVAAGTASAPVAQVKSVNLMIERYRGEFQKALARVMDVDRFMRIVITCVRQSEGLSRIALSNPASLIAAAMEVAQSGLDPSIPNEVFLVPYGDKSKGSKTEEIECQYGYKGLAKLALESARDAHQPIVVLRQEMICANDKYVRCGGDSPSVTLEYPPFGTERGEVIGFVAIAKDAAGQVHFHEMTVAEVRAHKERFSKAKFGPWADPKNFNAYGLKTVLRILINRHLPMGPKLARALQSDFERESREKSLTIVDRPPLVEIPAEVPSQVDPGTVEVVVEPTETQEMPVATAAPEPEPTPPPAPSKEEAPEPKEQPVQPSLNSEFERIKARAAKEAAK